ncbi:MAG: leucyl aminopeptidase [Vicinamibacteria bacterium]|nr:leucyl aminopeptidase [Vicinamibacteria bacterium]
MHIGLFSGPASKVNADLLVFLVDERENMHAIDDPAIAAVVSDAAARFKARTLARELIQNQGARTIVVFSSTHIRGLNTWETVKTVMAKALRLARDLGLPRVAAFFNHQDAAPLIGKAVEGAVLGAYTFDQHRVEKERFFKEKLALEIVVHPDHQADAEARKARYAWVSENVNLARDLINEPANVVTPQVLAERAQQIAIETGLQCEVLDETALKAKGYRGLLHVGAGSATPPRMVILRHIPRQSSAETIALVGKGLTFDSGGISIKSADKMWEMKGDMAGAAAVLAAMRTIGRLQPSVRVIGILCCAENMPGNSANRPGDIFMAKNGKSVMVDNTDAEGRLVLSDGLARAGEEGATHVVDVATLTGAVVRALGPSVAGILGSNPELVRRVIAAGESHGEAFWELPLIEEYRDSLKTSYADINNIASGGVAGAITAALFLREFVPEGAAWAHLDIAGPMFRDRDWRYYEAGALGFGVKTLVHLVERFREKF